jgi:hypothetical protein
MRILNQPRDEVYWPQLIKPVKSTLPCMRDHILLMKTRLHFIMAERLTHQNLKSNPWASYLFTAEEWKYQGKRLYLKKIKEEENPELIEQICRKCDYSHYETGRRYVVYFNIEKVLPLIGSGDST